MPTTPSDAMQSSVGRVGTTSTSRSHRSPHKSVHGPLAAPSKQTQTRWLSRAENTDSSSQLVHLNQSMPTKTARRRRSSSGLKALDSKLNNKGDVRSQRKCRSNEFHTGGSGAAAAAIESGGDSARDSDTNLLMENMRNRECELITKINSNQYYCCSSSENDDLVYLMKKHGTSLVNEANDGYGGGIGKRRKSPTNKAGRNNAKTVVMPQRLSVINQSVHSETRHSVIEYQTTTNELSRKVKFTITINRNRGIQSAGYQRVELNSHPQPIANIVVDDTEKPLSAGSAEIADCSEHCNSSSSVTDVECVDLSSSPNDSLLNRSGEYHDCCESSLNSQGTTISRCSSSSAGHNSSSTSSIYEDAVECHAASESPKVQREQQQSETAKMPMISIVQELTADNEVSSTVHVDRKQIDSYMDKQQVPRTLPTRAKPKRVTVIGDNFCSEVFSTLQQRNITLKHSESRKSDSCLMGKTERESYSSESATNDSVMSMRLHCVPKHSGTSIGRLLAARLEKNQMLSERRQELLKSLARENMPPPVKPPRSFTSSSSPSSKQSSEGISATTLPIGEAYRTHDVTKTCEEFFQPTFDSIQAQRQHEAVTQFGWVQSPKEAENGAPFGWVGANKSGTPRHGAADLGWTAPVAPSAPQIAPNDIRAPLKADQIPPHILGMLNYEQWQPEHSIRTTHSKPQPQYTAAQMPRENIDTVDSSAYFDRFSSESFPCSTPFATPVKPKSPQVVASEAIEQTVIEKRAPASSSSPPKPDKKGSSAMAKTLLGASKKFLKKPLQRKSPNESPNANAEVSSSVEKTKRGSDEATKFNSQAYSPNNHEKKSVKHLGFTPQKSNQVTIVNSPARNRDTCDEKLMRSSPMAKLNATEAAGKRDAGEFSKSAKVMVRLNKFAKSPKKLLQTLTRRKPSTDSRSKRNASYEEHYYKSFNSSTGKVPIMREILADLRQKVTGEDTQSHSVRRSLFRDEYASSEVLDEVSNQIADIDLHDEPEPLYAEVQLPDGLSAHPVDHTQRPPIETKEVYINSANELEPPRKYIMVNNDPSALYATVNNKMSASSSEPLDLNVISNFADSVENMIERQLFSSRPTQHANPMTSAYSPSTTDYYTGLEEHDFASLRQPIPLSDITSLDTFQTENLYETIIGDSDMNDEIRNDIQDLECSPATFDEISSDFEFGSPLRDCIRTPCRAIIEDLDESEDRAAEHESNDRDTVDYSIPSSIQADVDYARGINTIPSPSPGKSVKRSPSYKEIKHKFHKSMKKGTQYLKQEGRKISELLENSMSKSDRKSASSPRKIRIRSEINKYMDPEFAEALNFSNPDVQKLYDQLTQQLDIQHELREAIAYCRVTNEFENSAELVEAERLGLISMMKESTAENELDSICNEDEGNQMNSSSDTLAGTVTINSIRFTLKSDVLRDTQFNYFYVCTCVHRGNVQCTIVRERKGNKVVFNDCKLLFTALEPRFTINIEVHALCLRKSRPQNRTYESPGKKNQNSAGNESMSSESQFFATANDSLNSSTDISMFKLLGSTVLSSYDLCHQATRSDAAVTANKQLYSTTERRPFDFSMISDRNHLMHAIDIDFRTDITFALPRLTGFLNIADCNSNWNRRWCCLDSFTLKFWNYPQDINTPPISMIFLSDCACENAIVAASREVCAKPKSFVIDMFEAIDAADGDRRVQRYFISTDTAAELKSWLSEINRVISFMRDWHIG